jgi:hypothetical protein
MAGSKVPRHGLTPGIPSPKNSGPWGTNGDGGDPDTPRWFVGDTSGPVGLGDYAAPDSPMRHLGSPMEVTQGQPIAAQQCRDRISAYSASLTPEPRPPLFTPSDLAQAISKAERRLKDLNEDERALATEMGKVQRDLEVWKDVQKWFEVESGKRAVPVSESKVKFNDLRWGGTGVKVGGINTSASGDVVISKDFAESHRSVVTEGYRRHEQVHLDNFNGMGRFEAVWGYVRKGDSFVTDAHIKDELEAHKTQQDFYEECLRKLPAQKTELELQIIELRVQAQERGAPRKAP